jgi:hypothetical protein
LTGFDTGGVLNPYSASGVDWRRQLADPHVAAGAAGLELTAF